MISLKLFLDGLADENHPFRKGPDLGTNPAGDEGVDVVGDEVDVPEGKQLRFRLARINKN